MSPEPGARVLSQTEPARTGDIEGRGAEMSSTRTAAGQWRAVVTREEFIYIYIYIYLYIIYIYISTPEEIFLFLSFVFHNEFTRAAGATTRPTTFFAAAFPSTPLATSCPP